MLIPLTQGQSALCDDADAEVVSGFTWYAFRKKTTFYARSQRTINGVRENVFMHRLILPTRDGLMVDHINGNGLDNRRANLRPATGSQNCANRRPVRSAYRGVYERENGRYQAKIVVRPNFYYLGTFADARSAALAYDSAARNYFGEFAKLNFPAVIA